MLTKWFKTKNVATVVVEAPILEKEVEKVITSKDIQEDLHKSFEDDRIETLLDNMINLRLEAEEFLEKIKNKKL